MQRIEKKQNIEVGRYGLKESNNHPFVNLAAMILVFAALVLHAAAAIAETRTVTDHDGKDLSVPVSPKRVVALAPSVTEIVFALNREERLVGATRFSNYPEVAGRLPSVGSYVYLDVEKIVSLNPDLCIAIKDGNPLRAIRRLEGLGIPVFAVHPMKIDTVIRSIYDIGELLDAEASAQQLVADMKARMEVIDERISGISERPTVFFQIGVAPIVSAGSGTFIHELIERAGGKNAAGKFEGYPRFSKEEVLALAPDVMVLTSMARQKVFDDVVREWRQWEDLPAVRDDRIHIVDSDLYDRPSPRLVDGLEQLATLLHPNLFE